jgi:hypothetical protein
MDECDMASQCFYVLPITRSDLSQTRKLDCSLLETEHGLSQLILIIQCSIRIVILESHKGLPFQLAYSHNQ